MLNSESIKAFLAERRATYISKVKIRPSDDVILLTVPVSKIGQTTAPGTTSKRQLSFLSRALREEFGADVVMIFDQGDAYAQIESTLCAALKNQFQEHVDSIVLSFELVDASVVWVECKNSDAPKEKIERVISEFMSLMGMRSVEVHFLYATQQQPSLVLILREMKTIAPCRLEDILRALENKGYPFLRGEWLQGKLDLLRKKEVVIRQKDGTYCLTHLGLSVTPHGAYSTSSDVVRVLALGRAKW